jgi:hypothetical protein
VGTWGRGGAWACRRVPEGQHDRSLARSAWESVPRKNRPGGYGMIRYGARLIPEVSPARMCTVFLPYRLNGPRNGQRRIRKRHIAANHTVPYGTALLGGTVPRHFVPGYDRVVPPGHVHTPHVPTSPRRHAPLTASSVPSPGRATKYCLSPPPRKKPQSDRRSGSD